MSDNLVYLILAAAFCIIPTFVISIIVMTIRYLNKPTAAKPTPSRATPKPAAAPRTAAGAKAIPAPPAGGFTPLYLNFSNKPLVILENLNHLKAQVEKANANKERWKKGPRILFLLGLGMMLVDAFLFILGYTTSCAFITGGVALWAVAIVFSVSLKRAQVNAFPPTFQEFEAIVQTLRDDLRPGTGLIGNLDLTGARQAAKVAREANDTKGRTTQYFRDQWLNFKAKMYDGNILRVSGIQRIKERKGYTARGRISGKTKWKPAKFKGTYQELKVRIAVNPEMYQIIPKHQIKAKGQVGEYTINAVETEGGIVSVLASSPKESVSAESVLCVLKFAYELLKMKNA